MHKSNKKELQMYKKELKMYKKNNIDSYIQNSLQKIKKSNIKLSQQVKINSIELINQSSIDEQRIREQHMNDQRMCEQHMHVNEYDKKVYKKHNSREIKYLSSLNFLNIYSSSSIYLENKSEKLKNDKKFVFDAVTYYGGNLEFASEKLQNNKKIVFAAVLDKGFAIKYASDELKNNQDIVLTAIKDHEIYFKYANEKLKNDKKFILIAIQYNCKILKFISEKLKNDKNFMLNVIKINLANLEYASKELQNNKEFLITCYKKINKLSDENIFNKIGYESMQFINKFNKIENNIFNDNKFLYENYDILHLVKNKIKNNLFDYLVSKEKYKIIYQNEKFHEYIKKNRKIILLCINDLDIENIFMLDELKL
jgi:hypothetical protein